MKRLDPRETRIGGAWAIAYLISGLSASLRWVIPGLFLAYALHVALRGRISSQERRYLWLAVGILAIACASTFYGGIQQISFLLFGPLLALVLVGLSRTRVESRADGGAVVLLVAAMTVVLLADVVAGKTLFGRSSVAVAVALGVLATVFAVVWLIRRTPGASRERAVER